MELNIHGGGKIWGKWVSYQKDLLKLFVFALKHGTYLHLVLDFGNILVSESYQSYESLRSFNSPKECPSYCRTMIWYISLSIQCYQVICRASKCSREVFNPNQLLYSITKFHPRVSLCSFELSSCITFLCQFHVDDGGNIMALLQRIYSCQLQHIIQELELETNQ